MPIYQLEIKDGDDDRVWELVVSAPTPKAVRQLMINWLVEQYLYDDMDEDYATSFEFRVWELQVDGFDPKLPSILRYRYSLALDDDFTLTSAEKIVHLITTVPDDNLAVAV